jgi:mannosylglycerate hydrolase
MRPTYHIVSHSHWDREWYRSFEYFRAMLVHMVDDLLDLLARDPAYRCFTLDGQTSTVEDYLDVRPEREEELRRYVKGGRLFIGPWYVLPDEFLVSGESTVRNLMMGRRIAHRFGAEMKVGYIPDSFGHIASMPTILKGFDIDNVILYRGFGGEPGQDTSEYWWHAPDGTQALMIHLYKDGYSGGYFHDSTRDEMLHRFAVVKKELDARATTSHRLLMNGGDHHWPDEKLPQQLALLAKQYEGNFIHSNLPAYVAAVKAEASGKAPDLMGELRFGYRYAFVVIGGVYSSRMYLKQENWKCETFLERYVEPLNAIAVSGGARSSMPLIRQAWKTLLQNHPHDSICGCSIDLVHREMMTRFAAVSEIGRAVVDECFNAILPADTRASHDDTHLFFFNPSAFSRSGVAQAEVRFYLQDVVVGLNPDVSIASKLPPVKGFALVDAQGNVVPYQILSRGEGYDITYNTHNYPKQTRAEIFSILVDAADVPSLGVKGVKIERRNSFPGTATLPAGVRVRKNSIENDLLRVDISARGEVTVTDKVNNARYAHLAVFEDGGDVGDEYNYSYPRKDRIVRSNTKAAKLSVVEKGPLRGAIRIVSSLTLPVSASPDRHSRSTKSAAVELTTIVSLGIRSRAVEFVTNVNNTVKDHRLRVLFPTGIKTNTCHADEPFYVAEREQKKYDLRNFPIEHPAAVASMQRFVMVKGHTAAHTAKGSADTVPAYRSATLFTAGLPEYELQYNSSGTLALTLLRCVGLLAGGDLITRPGGRGGWHNETPDAQCAGAHTLRYAFFPQCGNDEETMEHVNEEAERFHLPFMSVSRKNTEPMTMESSLLSLSTKTAVLSAVKESEDQDGIIVRWWNPGAQKISVSVDTRIGTGQASSAKLNEEPLTPCSLAGIMTKPRSITTLRIK